MYFHTNDPRSIEFIVNVASLALEQGQRLRIDTDEKGNLRIKRGEGMWSPPLGGEPDPYRDNRFERRDLIQDAHDRHQSEVRAGDG